MSVQTSYGYKTARGIPGGIYAVLLRLLVAVSVLLIAVGVLVLVLILRAVSDGLSGLQNVRARILRLSPDGPLAPLLTPASA